MIVRSTISTMSDESAKVEVVRNDLEDRYEIHVGEHLAGFAQYRERGTRRIFFHTEIADGFSGRGLAGVLAKRAIQETIEQGRVIVPLCPFIAAYLKKHPEYDAHVRWGEAETPDPGTPATPAEPSA
jgi:predicted GNAT family acetyltransferase